LGQWSKKRRAAAAKKESLEGGEREVVGERAKEHREEKGLMDESVVLIAMGQSRRTKRIEMMSKHSHR